MWSPKIQTGHRASQATGSSDGHADTSCCTWLLRGRVIGRSSMPDGGNPSSGEEIPLPPRIKDVIVIGAGQSYT